MYSYEKMRPTVLTPEGQRKLIDVVKRAHAYLDDGTPFTIADAMHGLGGSSWANLAVIEYLLELRFFKRVPTAAGTITQQQLLMLAS